MEYNHLTKEQATAFFSHIYYGEHHIPGEVKHFGVGFYVTHDRGDMATFDFNQLTRLVLLAHDKCIRVSVEGMAKNKIRIAIWKRQGREGNMSLRHPTIEEAIYNFVSYQDEEVENGGT